MNERRRIPILASDADDDRAHPSCVLVVSESGCGLPPRIVDLLAHANDGVLIVQQADESCAHVAARVHQRASLWRRERRWPDAAIFVLKPSSGASRFRARAVITAELTRCVEHAGGEVTLTDSESRSVA